MKAHLQFRLFILAVLSIGVYSFAHEGHDHAPGHGAPHGGVVKEGKNFDLELVTQGQEIRLYPLDKKGQSILAQNLVISATAQPPKQAKADLRLVAEKEYFTAKADPKGSYRFELSVTATYQKQKNEFRFQVETESIAD